MLITFDPDVAWDASVLYLWANCDGDRILCRAGRETINELPNFTHASSSEITKSKVAIGHALKPSFEHKIRMAAFDAAKEGTAKVVTIARHEIIKGVEPASAYFVSWVRDGKTSRFATAHTSLDTALEFACEAFKIECSDVWISDNHGRKVADRTDIAKYADRTGKPYN